MSLFLLLTSSDINVLNFVMVLTFKKCLNILTLSEMKTVLSLSLFFFFGYDSFLYQFPKKAVRQGVVI